MALTSKYKSEFLANMSHELRTPLSSLLILSDQLAKNPEHNLTPREVEFAQTNHASGNDLLSLINDILELSKIESGTVVLDVGEVTFRDLHEYVDRSFRHVADAKKLDFALAFDPQLPVSMRTDVKRLQQILKNLLSNAFKFTDKGSVSLHVAPAESGWSADNKTLQRAPAVIAISVVDTGIGIQHDKQQNIYEAFQQADGSTSRKYGGTGLGLAISRELANLLGGEIRLTSAPNEGSAFTLYLPHNYNPTKSLRRDSVVAPPSGQNVLAAPVGAADEFEALAAAPAEVFDDRGHLQPTDRVLLIIENEPTFARLLLETSHEQGVKAVVAGRGTEGLIWAQRLLPHAIPLDMHLPDMDGWRVQARFTEDLHTRHIPVFVITTEEDAERGLKMGAIGTLAKPLKSKDELGVVFSRIKEARSLEPQILLVAGPEDERRAELVDLVAGDDVQTIALAAGAAAVTALADQRPACVVIGLANPCEPAFELLEEIRKRPRLASMPVIVDVLESLSAEDEQRLKRFAQHLLLKDVRSPERLIDETALFLHRPVGQLPAA